MTERRVADDQLEMEGSRPRGSKVSLTDQAYRIIRKEIMECALAPGLEFTELDIAERFAMSKTPVREALMRLQFEGLVKAYPRRGYLIEPVKISDINEIFEMRLILEGGAMDCAVQRASDEDIRKLYDIAQSISDAIYHEEPDRSHKVNNLFHESLALAARNARLHRSLVQTLNELERFFYIEARASIDYPDQHATHRDIVSALERRDAAAARAAIIDHIEGTRRVLLASLVESNPKTPRSVRLR
jgi:DNA-binding GntR family transcriptional regulator